MQTLLLVAVLVFVRVTACIAFLPAPFGRSVPVTVKIGLAMALTWFSIANFGGRDWLSFAASIPTDAGWTWLAYWTVREVCLGWGLAWLLGLAIVPIRTAGAYLSQELGLSMGSMTSPLDQSPSDVVSQVLESVMTLITLGLNVHLAWIVLLQHSLRAAPVLGGWSIPSAELAAARLSQATQLGVLSVGPVAVAMLMTLIFILVASRTSPQLNLFSFGMPVRAVFGCVVVLIFLPEILAGLTRATQVLLDTRGS